MLWYSVSAIHYCHDVLACSAHAVGSLKLAFKACANQGPEFDNATMLT